MMLLAFRYLIDPLSAEFPQMNDYWLLLAVPLVVAISIVYKGTRIVNLRRLPRETVTMSAQIVVLMAVAAGILQGLCWAWIHFL